MERTGTHARLELIGVTKSYASIVANDDVSLTVAPGAIHAVLGENGAGKSTLMKVIYGLVKADRGQMLWNGRPVDVVSPAEARALGIGMVFQHFSLFPVLTVLENLLLSSPPGTPRAEVVGRTNEIAERHSMRVELDRTVHTLSVGEQQNVEIIRCLLQDPTLLILDEPTSVLTPQAVEELFGMLRSVASNGCSIVYISHKLHEALELCDAVTILRRGKVVANVDPGEENTESLARHMLGDVTASLNRSQQASLDKVRLSVSHLNRDTDDDFGVSLNDICVEVHGAEIHGIAGIAGNGQAELLEALSGEWNGPPTHRIQIDGSDAAHLGPLARRALGLVYIPEERLGHGAVPQLSLSKNALLTTRLMGFTSRGFISFSAVAKFAQYCIEKFDVRSGSPSAEAMSLSGGNLQKFIIGRELSQSPGVIIAAQPTWGLDIGATHEIRQLLLSMRDSGVAIIVVSQDIDELFEICDTISVMSSGTLSPANKVADTTSEQVGLLMSGEAGSHLAAKPVVDCHALET